MRIMRKPNWNFWKYMSEVEPWQAVALALNIDPDLLGKDPYPSGNPYVWDNNPSSDYFANKEIIQQYQNLRQLLKANQFNQKDFSISIRGTIRLDEFAAWCIEIRQDIPDELKALAKHTAQPIPVTPEEALQSTTTPTDAKISEEDEELAGLFDPVPVETLEKMFPADGKWKKWANKAKQSGLINARTEQRAKYNPYDAAMWFLSKGITGWDLARCYRVLANNLPHRSRNKAHMLTDFLD